MKSRIFIPSILVVLTITSIQGSAADLNTSKIVEDILQELAKLDWRIAEEHNRQKAVGAPMKVLKKLEKTVDENRGLRKE